jgi:hypothetical protein
VRCGIVVATAVAAISAPALAATTTSAITYQDTVAKGAPVAVTVTTHRPAAFRVLLHVRTVGRTRLFLTGGHAPSGGILIDTKTYACEGTAGSFSCKAAYESLPAGTYTWRIVRVSGAREPVTLTVRW